MTEVSCAGCGMPKSEWTRNDGQGFLREGLLFCCQGCAEYDHCTCWTERDRKRSWMAPPRVMFSKLNQLIKSCWDAEHGFRTAAEQADGELAAFLEGLAERRAGFAAELERQVEDWGGHAVDRGSFDGMIRRHWIAITAALEAQSLGRVLKECEDIVDHSIAAYHEAIHMTFPVEVEAVVRRQYDELLRTEQKIHRLEEDFVADRPG